MDYSFLKPYKVEEKRLNSIIIFEPKGRKIFLFIFFRIFPLLIITGVLLILKFFKFPSEMKYALLLIPIIFFFVFIKKYILSTEISKYSVKISYHTIRGVINEEFLINEIDKIIVESYYQSRSGGYYYFLVLNNNKSKIPFLTIPFLYMREKNKKMIHDKLFEITGKNVFDN